MLEGLPDVVRRYFELDPHDVDAFVSLFSDDATVVDEGKTYHGLGEVRAWRAGPAIKYNYTTELLDHEDQSVGRHLVTARLTGDFPGETGGPEMPIRRYDRPHQPSRDRAVAHAARLWLASGCAT